MVGALLLCFGFNAMASTTTFTDTEHWAKYYIEYAVEKGYFNGISSTEFGPEEVMSRGMFVTVLARYDGVDLDADTPNAFSDVSENAYYADAVNWAYQNDIIDGTGTLASGDRTFSPNSPITREQVAVIIDNYFDYTCDYPDVINDITAYSDDSNISSWAKDAVYNMQAYGILGGYYGAFSPKGQCTRAEAAAIISRMDGQDLTNYVYEHRTYLGTYRLTGYCSGCNTPRGSRQTSSGALATDGEYGTIAVCKSMYNEYGAGAVIYIEGIGYRTIQDIHGNSSSVIDVYLGTGSCSCSSWSLSNSLAKVYLVRNY